MNPPQTKTLPLEYFRAIYRPSSSAKFEMFHNVWWQYFNTRYEAVCASASSGQPVVIFGVPFTVSGTLAAVSGGGGECDEQLIPDPECEPSGGGGGGGGGGGVDCQIEFICIDVWNGTTWTTIWCGNANTCA